MLAVGRGLTGKTSSTTTKKERECEPAYPEDVHSELRTTTPVQLQPVDLNVTHKQVEVSPIGKQPTQSPLHFVNSSLYDG
jgi:hypothetical protein